MNTIIVTDPMTLEDKIKEARQTNSILLIEDIDEFFKVHDADSVAEMLDGVQLYDKEEYDWVQKCRKSLRNWANEN
jgi:hypothetical protein